MISDRLLPPIENEELIQRIGQCFPNLREALEAVGQIEAVLFFISMNYDQEFHIQPIIMPVQIANRLMGEILTSKDMPEAELSNCIANTLTLMRLNTAKPAPMILHFEFLKMFEIIAFQAMADKRLEVSKLAELDIGDLVILQMEIKETQMTSGLCIISNALDLYRESFKIMTAPTTYTVH